MFSKLTENLEIQTICTCAYNAKKSKIKNGGKILIFCNFYIIYMHSKVTDNTGVGEIKNKLCSYVIFVHFFWIQIKHATIKLNLKFFHLIIMQLKILYKKIHKCWCLYLRKLKKRLHLKLHWQRWRNKALDLLKISLIYCRFNTLQLFKKFLWLIFARKKFKNKKAPLNAQALISPSSNYPFIQCTLTEVCQYYEC